MANPYYTPSGTPGTSAQGSSSDIRSEFSLIQTGLDKLPDLTADFVVVVNSGGTALVPVASLTVAQGGTGVTTLTDGGILLGSGTGAITALAVLADGEMIVGDGTTDPSIESGATLRTSIGLGTGDAVAFSSLTLTTDLAVAEGGTGSSTASGARTNLGLGSLATLSTINDGNWSGTDLALVNGGTGSSTASGARTNLGLGSLATLNTINNGNWSGTDLSVSNGGTGVSTLTNGGVLLGSGTGGITAMAVLANGAMIVGDGSADPVAESGATLRTSIGLGSLATLSSINNGNWSGTDLAVVNGGTGSSTASGAATNLALGTGNTVTFLNIHASGTTDSTSTTTGSLHTHGGLGVVKNIHCNGNLINTHTSDTNTRVGVGAADITTSGTNNSAFGHDSLGANISGINNSAFGFESLLVTTGTGNTGFGLAALSGNTSGGSNIGVGWGGGQDITTGFNNTIIGQFALAGTGGANNRIVIGDGISGTADNQFSLGKVSNVVSNDFGTDAVWTRSSDERRKQDTNPLKLGLSFINDLEPITYRWKSADQYPKEWDIDPKTEIDTDTIMTGMLAQQVKKALDKANTGIRFPGWKELDNGMQQISGEVYIFPLINAVNELTARLEALEIAHA